MLFYIPPINIKIQLLQIAVYYIYRNFSTMPPSDFIRFQQCTPRILLDIL